MMTTLNKYWCLMIKRNFKFHHPSGKPPWTNMESPMYLVYSTKGAWSCLNESVSLTWIGARLLHQSRFSFFSFFFCFRLVTLAWAVSQKPCWMRFNATFVFWMTLRIYIIHIFTFHLQFNSNRVLALECWTNLIASWY